MLFYERAPYYMFIHFLFGFIAVWVPSIGVLAVLYQILQFIFNVRTFPLELTIKPGNNITHTGLKLVEMGIGYSVGLLVKKYIFPNSQDPQPIQEAQIEYQAPHRDSPQV